jgi:CDP-glycerol glycerophosphotransferase (TagB/SpsB family)
MAELKMLNEIKNFITRRSRYGASFFFASFIYLIISCLFGWLLVIPLSKLIPRRKNRYVIIGRDGGKFLDNTKYLYIYLHSIRNGEKPDTIFLTENRESYQQLSDKGLAVMWYPSVRSILTLLSCSTVIVDHDYWAFKFKYFFLYHARKIQLWHGVGIKYIGLLKLRNEMRNRLMRMLQIAAYRAIGLIPRYDCVVTTSSFYSENVFAGSFRTRDTLEAGYPRNDILFSTTHGDINEYSMINTDEESYGRILSKKKDGNAIVLYAPTFRDSGNTPFTDRVLELERLNEYGMKNKMVFIFKFHPDPYFDHESVETSNIVWYDNDKDAYPLLPFTDLLITDYSAIFMDYLLLDKPIIFFPYDYQRYMESDRGLQFDYEWITPGLKCFDQDALEQELKKIVLEGIDEYGNKRQEMRAMAFTYPDGNSAKRIWDYMKQQAVRGTGT